MEDGSGYGLAVPGIDAAGDGFGVGSGLRFGAICMRGNGVHGRNWMGEGPARTGAVSPVDKLRVCAGLIPGEELYEAFDHRAGARAILVWAEERGRAWRKCRPGCHGSGRSLS